MYKFILVISFYIFMNSVYAHTEPVITEIKHAIQIENINRILSTIARGAVNLKDTDGQTPIYTAIKTENSRIVSILIIHGAIVRTVDHRFSTPLHHSVEVGSEFITARILKEDPNVNAQDKDGNSPLHIASKKKGKPSLTRMLIRKGASVHLTNNKGQTPLHIASIHNNIEAAEQLLGNDADPNARSKEKLTPLHIAGHNNYLRMVNLLLSKKANPSTPNPAGYTLLHLAVRINNISLTSVLLQHGADVNALDKEGNTPLDILRKKEIKTKFSNVIETMLLSNGGKSSNQCQRSFVQQN